MNRRTFTQAFGAVVASICAGCNHHQSDRDEWLKVLTIFPRVVRVNDTWELTARVRNDYDWDVSIHDITLLAFNDSGGEICRTFVGDLIRREGPDRTVTVTCDQFPAIISATTAESPCQNINIPIVYWIGTTEQRGADLPNGIKVWEETYRKCNEPVPPDRVLEQVHTTQEESRGPL